MQHTIYYLYTHTRVHTHTAMSASTRICACTDTGSPLGWAAGAGLVDAVKLLLSKGAGGCMGALCSESLLQVHPQTIDIFAETESHCCISLDAD